MPFQYPNIIKDMVKVFLAEADRKPHQLPQLLVSDRVPQLKVRCAHYADRKGYNSLQLSDNNVQPSYGLLADKFDYLDHRSHFVHGKQRSGVVDNNPSQLSSRKSCT